MTDNRTTELTVTDRLRELLDERGVEYETDERNAITEWSTYYGAFVFFARQREGKLLVETTVATKHSVILTPEQAIAATLGSGTCELEYIDTYEYPDGEEDYLCKCSKCGRKSWEPAHNLPKFCGGCGRMVKR